MAAFERIVGRFVYDVPKRMEVFEAFVIGSFRADFTDSHDLISADADWVSEPVAVPELK